MTAPYIRARDRRPCPFCECRKIVPVARGYRLRCVHCTAEVPTTWWNTRPGDVREYVVRACAPGRAVGTSALPAYVHVLGRRQRGVLRSLSEHGAFYDKNDLRFHTWTWDGFASTKRIVLSLFRKGLVRRDTECFSGWGTVPKYVLAELGAEAAAELRARGLW